MPGHETGPAKVWDSSQKEWQEFRAPKGSWDIYVYFFIYIYIYVYIYIFICVYIYMYVSTHVRAPSKKSRLRHGYDDAGHDDAGLQRL